jgi:phenylalanyl-tRNA synthetase beta chain
MLDFIKKLFKKKDSHKNFVPQVDHIIAAKVTAIEKHPNADRLRVISLTDGQRTISPVVCGAFNFDVGAIVPLALPGATIPKNIHSETHESFVLGTAKIRGIESQGMICAEYELGLTDELGDKPEIMILPEDTRIGKILF